jgi:hypothetical protein
MNIGFSTGSLALGNFREGIKVSKQVNATVIELSALREQELSPLIQQISTIDLSAFEYISIHAPSKLSRLSENDCIDLLMAISKYDFPIIVHPDIITDHRLWRRLESRLCIENMDKRKPVGRTYKELAEIFKIFPDARFCLDLAHAKQVDATMLEAKLMIKNFGERLAQLHISDVNSNSRHEPLNLEAILSFRKVADAIPSTTPIVIESPVPPEFMAREMKAAALLFDSSRMNSILNFVGLAENQRAEVA